MKETTYLIDTKVFNTLYHRHLSGSIFHQQADNDKTRIKIASGSRKYVKDVFAQVKIELTPE